MICDNICHNRKSQTAHIHSAGKRRTRKEKKQPFRIRWRILQDREENQMMKKIYAILFALCILLFCAAFAEDSSDETPKAPDLIIPVTPQTEVPGGWTGIQSARDMAQIVYHPEEKYILMADIELTDTNADRELLDYLRRTEFTGELDGNGHYIRWSFYMPVIMTEEQQVTKLGFFYALNGATVRNLSLEGKYALAPDSQLMETYMPKDASAEILDEIYPEETYEDDGEHVKNHIYAGGLAAIGMGSFTIENCAVKVHMEYGGIETSAQQVAIFYGLQYGYEQKPYYKGGLLGMIFKSESARIAYCRNTASIAGESYVGGLVGLDKGAGTDYYACRNDGAVTARVGIAGGIVACTEQNVSIRECANFGTVKGDNLIGGIVGNVFGGGTISDCLNMGNVRATQWTFDTAEYELTKEIAGKYGFNVELNSSENQADYDALTRIAQGMAEGNPDTKSNYWEFANNYVAGGFNQMSLMDLATRNYTDVAAGGITGSGDVRVERCVNYGRVIAEWSGEMAISGSNHASNLNQCYAEAGNPDIVALKEKVEDAAGKCTSFSLDISLTRDVFSDGLDFDRTWTFIDQGRYPLPAALSGTVESVICAGADVLPDGAGSYASRYGWPITNSRESFCYPDEFRYDSSKVLELFGYYDTPPGILNILSAAPATVPLLSDLIASIIDKPVDTYGGNCFGVSLVSLAGYYNLIDLSEYFRKSGQYLHDCGFEYIYTGENGQIYTIDLNQEAIDLVERAQFMQYATCFRNVEFLKGDYSALLTFLQGNDARPILAKIGDTHAIVITTDFKPFAVTDEYPALFTLVEQENGWWCVPIYDPNAPVPGDLIADPSQDYIGGYTTLLIQPETSESRLVIWGKVWTSESGRKLLSFYDVSQMSSSDFSGTVSFLVPEFLMPDTDLYEFPANPASAD